MKGNSPPGTSWVWAEWTRRHGCPPCWSAFILPLSLQLGEQLKQLVPMSGLTVMDLEVEGTCVRFSPLMTAAGKRSPWGTLGVVLRAPVPGCQSPGCGLIAFPYEAVFSPWGGFYFSFG